MKEEMKKLQALKLQAVVNLAMMVSESRTGERKKMMNTRDHSGHTMICCCKAATFSVAFYLYLKEIHASLHGH